MQEGRVISTIIKNGQNVLVVDRFYVDTLKAAHETSDWTRLFEVATEARAKDSKFDNWVRKAIAYQHASAAMQLLQNGKEEEGESLI